MIDDSVVVGGSPRNVPTSTNGARGIDDGAADCSLNATSSSGARRGSALLASGPDSAALSDSSIRAVPPAVRCTANDVLGDSPAGAASIDA